MDIFSLISQLGFPAAIAAWSLYQLRQESKDSKAAYVGLSEQFITSLQQQRVDYASMLKEVCKQYEGLCINTNGAIEKNTTALNGLEHAIDRMNGRT
jgi:hypothetical protein